MSTGNGAGPIIEGGQTRAGGQVGRVLGTGVVVGKDESPENLKEKSEGAWVRETKVTGKICVAGARGLEKPNCFQLLGVFLCL